MTLPEPLPDCGRKIILWSAYEGSASCPCPVMPPQPHQPPVAYSIIRSRNGYTRARVDSVTHGTVYSIQVWYDEAFAHITVAGFTSYDYTVDNVDGFGPDHSPLIVAEKLVNLINGVAEEPDDSCLPGSSNTSSASSSSSDSSVESDEVSTETLVHAHALRDGTIVITKGGGSIPFLARMLKDNSLMTDFEVQWPMIEANGGCMIVGNIAYDEEGGGGVSRVSNLLGFSSWGVSGNAEIEGTEVYLRPCTEIEYTDEITAKSLIIFDSSHQVWRARVTRNRFIPCNLLESSSSDSSSSHSSASSSSSVASGPPTPDPLHVTPVDDPSSSSEGPSIRKFGIVTTEEIEIYTYTTTLAEEEGSMADLAAYIATDINASGLFEDYTAISCGDWVELYSTDGSKQIADDNRKFSILWSGYRSLTTWAADQYDTTPHYGLDMTGWDVNLLTLGEQETETTLLDPNKGYETFEYLIEHPPAIDETIALDYVNAFNSWVEFLPEFKGFGNVYACRTYRGHQYRGTLSQSTLDPAFVFLPDDASDQNGYYNDCRIVVTSGLDEAFAIRISARQEARCPNINVGTFSYVDSELTGYVIVTYGYDVSTCTGNVPPRETYTVTEPFSGTLSNLSFYKFHAQGATIPPGEKRVLHVTNIQIVTRWGWEGEAHFDRTAEEAAEPQTAEVHLERDVTFSSEIFPQDIVIKDHTKTPVRLERNVLATVIPIVKNGQQRDIPAYTMNMGTAVHVATISSYEVTELDGITYRRANVEAPGFDPLPNAGDVIRIYRHVGVEFKSDNPDHPALNIAPTSVSQGSTPDVFFRAVNGNNTSAQMPMGWDEAGVIQRQGVLAGFKYNFRFAGTAWVQPEENEYGYHESPDSVSYDTTASFTTVGGETAADLAGKFMTAYNAVDGDIPEQERPIITNLGDGTLFLEGKTYTHFDELGNEGPVQASPIGFSITSPSAKYFYKVISYGYSSREEVGAWWFYEDRLGEIAYEPFVGWPYLGSTTEWHSANIATANIVGSQYTDVDCSNDPPPAGACPGKCNGKCYNLDAYVSVGITVTWNGDSFTPGGDAGVGGTYAMFSGCGTAGFSGGYGAIQGYPTCGVGVHVGWSSTGLCPKFGQIDVAYTETAGGGPPPCGMHLVAEYHASIYWDDRPHIQAWVCSGADSCSINISFHNQGSWRLGTLDDVKVDGCTGVVNKCLAGTGPTDSNPLP